MSDVERKLFISDATYDIQIVVPGANRGREITIGSQVSLTGLYTAAHDATRIVPALLAGDLGIHGGFAGARGERAYGGFGRATLSGSYLGFGWVTLGIDAILAAHKLPGYEAGLFVLGALEMRGPVLTLPAQFRFEPWVTLGFGSPLLDRARLAMLVGAGLRFDLLPSNPGRVQALLGLDVFWSSVPRRTAPPTLLTPALGLSLGFF